MKRSAAGARHLKIFVLCGIATVLVTRVFLALTGYPKLGDGDDGGGSSVHISHMLWGGLLMMAGVVLLLSVTGLRAQAWGAVLSGAGFGLFIDQIGKQVSDEGYDYAPAAGLIYLTFALLALLAWRDGRATVALLRLLEQLPRRSPRASPLRDIQVRVRLILTGRHAVTVLVALAVLQSVLRLGRISAELIAGRADEPEWNALLAAAAFAAVTLLLTLQGARLLRRDRVAAFRYLTAAVLIDLLPGQVFGFIAYQFSAVQDLVIGLLLLYAITGERRDRDRGRRPDAGGQDGTRRRPASA